MMISLISIIFMGLGSRSVEGLKKDTEELHYNKRQDHVTFNLHIISICILKCMSDKIGSFMRVQR